MATSKTADKKSASKKSSASSAPAINPLETLADDVLVTLVHRALVRLGEPARISEIAREIDDESISAALVRHALETHPRRFVAVDRRWDIAQRYLDKQRAVERTLEELVSLYGAPMPQAEIPGELAQIYGRVREHFDDVAPRLLRGKRFFPVANGLSYGLRSWLLDTEAANDDDLLFYNYLSTAAIQPFQSAAKGLDWAGDPVAAAHKVVTTGADQPVDNRIVQFLAFKSLGEEFEGADLYAALATSGTLLALPDHRWLAVEALEPLRALWRKMGEQAAQQMPDELVAEATVESAPQPLEITEDDLAELRRHFDNREDIVTVTDLLTDVLEVRPASRTFIADKATLTEFLKAHPDDFVWVGTERFRAPDTLPPYIGQLPESLTFPTLPRFETADGEILDQMLADDAFEDGLAEEILDSVAQDVNDQDPNDRTRWAEGVSGESSSLRLVIKAHHKEIGTFPLSQIPYGFFPQEPAIVELTLRDTQGTGYPIYVDYNVQLVYGLFDVYADIAADSGAVFTLEKTDKPDEYRFLSSNETDPGVFVNPNRSEELLEYRNEIENGSLVSTYDIIRTILDHYRKGTSFLTLLTEVNLVRRTPRRLIASILSGYTAFHPRANRWTFDAKKEPEGFDKNKSGFVLKR